MQTNVVDIEKQLALCREEFERQIIDMVALAARNGATKEQIHKVVAQAREHFARIQLRNRDELNAVIDVLEAKRGVLN